MTENTKLEAINFITQIHNSHIDSKINELRKKLLDKIQSRKDQTVSDFKRYIPRSEISKADEQVQQSGRSRSRSPKKSSRRRRSSFRSRSRSHSPKKSSKDYKDVRPFSSPTSSSSSNRKIMYINRINNGKWLKHFNKYSNDFIDLCRRDRELTIFICDERKIRLSERNVSHLLELYNQRDKLCSKCYNGDTLKNNGVAYCYNCSFIIGKKCIGKLTNCGGYAFPDKFTYSSYEYCKNCHHTILHSSNVKSKDITVISDLINGNWILHFVNNKTDILNLYENSESKTFVFSDTKHSHVESINQFNGRLCIKFDKQNVIDIINLFNKIGNLCPDCLHGKNISPFGLLCKHCIKYHEEAICHYEGCTTSLSVDKITYSTNKYCIPCLNKLIYDTRIS